MISPIFTPGLFGLQLLGLDAVQLRKFISTFWMNILPLSAGLRGYSQRQVGPHYFSYEDEGNSFLLNFTVSLHKYGFQNSEDLNLNSTPLYLSLPSQTYVVLSRKIIVITKEISESTHSDKCCS